ncbi:MAG TPA: hypothetical protein VGH79_11875 [Gaiellaceae bacterium]|jgi:hypothetical protein
MKIALALATLATFVTAGMATSLALATPSHKAAAPKTLKIVMHDPGCHWFQVGSKFKTTATANGAVRLVNVDEATLKVSASGHVLKRIPVGKSVVVRSGHYTITMVGQASDDNHLKLTVR